MKLYRSTFNFSCVAGHSNLLADRTFAATAQEAQKISYDRLRIEPCTYCERALISVSSVRTEEIALSSQYWTFGYVCSCGERVPVLTEKIGEQFEFPDEITARCSKGHCRRLMRHEFPTLLRWREEKSHGSPSKRYN
jgi:hypothetical protein